MWADFMAMRENAGLRILPEDFPDPLPFPAMREDLIAFLALGDGDAALRGAAP
jgi:hypothetical protein